jgi:hypothetical protein
MDASVLRVGRKRDYFSFRWKSWSWFGARSTLEQLHQLRGDRSGQHSIRISDPRARISSGGSGIPGPYLDKDKDKDKDKDMGCGRHSLSGGERVEGE